MKIRISGEMETPSTEELSAEASAYIAGMFKLANIVKPRLDEIIPDPAFMLTSGGNSFFAYTETDHSKIGDGRLEPALCLQVICPNEGKCFVMPRVYEFEGSRAEVEGDQLTHAIIGTFGFTSNELYDLDALVYRFRALLKGMLFRGAWGGPIEISSNRLLTPAQKNALLLETGGNHAETNTLEQTQLQDRS